MTRSRSCGSGGIRSHSPSPADARREKVPLSTNSDDTADRENQANTAYATHAANPGVEVLPALLELANEVLGVRCDPGSNFFDHGDSMAAAQLCALGAKRHGWMVTPRDVFGWESFAHLAQVIERDEAERHVNAAMPGQGGP